MKPVIFNGRLGMALKSRATRSYICRAEVPGATLKPEPGSDLLKTASGVRSYANWLAGLNPGSMLTGGVTFATKAGKAAGLKSLRENLQEGNFSG